MINWLLFYYKLFENGNEKVFKISEHGRDGMEQASFAYLSLLNLRTRKEKILLMNVNFKTKTKLFTVYFHYDP